MSLSNESNPSAFFSVVGAAYVPEHHGDEPGHLSVSYPNIRQPVVGMAWLWLAFCGLIIGASLFGHGSASKLTHFASVVLN